jgi:hypothetical protein
MGHNEAATPRIEQKVWNLHQLKKAKRCMLRLAAAENTRKQ